MLWVEHMHPKFQRLFLDLQEIQVKPFVFPWYLLNTFLEFCLFSVLSFCLLAAWIWFPSSSTRHPALLFSYLFSIQRGCRGRGWAFTFGLKPKVNFFVQKAEPKMNCFDAENVSSLGGNPGHWSGEGILLLLHPGSMALLPPLQMWGPTQLGGREGAHRRGFGVQWSPTCCLQLHSDLWDGQEWVWTPLALAGLHRELLELHKSHWIPLKLVWQLYWDKKKEWFSLNWSVCQLCGWEAWSCFNSMRKWISLK